MSFVTLVRSLINPVCCPIQRPGGPAIPSTLAKSNVSNVSNGVGELVGRFVIGLDVFFTLFSSPLPSPLLFSSSLSFPFSPLLVLLLLVLLVVPVITGRSSSPSRIALPVLELLSEKKPNPTTNIIGNKHQHRINNNKIHLRDRCSFSL
jgi:hypothetical protein